MTDDVAKLSPAQRLTKGLCPECGASLAGINVLAERNSHWDREPRDQPEYREARTRWTMMTNYAAEIEAKAEAARVDARRAATA